MPEYEYRSFSVGKILVIRHNSTKATEKPDVTGLLEAIKYVDATIAEVDKIKVNLLGIKAQIQKFVKK